MEDEQPIEEGTLPQEEHPTNEEEDENFYKEVDVDEEEEEEEEATDGVEDLESTLQLIQKRQREQQEKEELIRTGSQPLRPKVEKRPEVIDDFIRNFLNKNNMSKTLESFEVYNLYFLLQITNFR